MWKKITGMAKPGFMPMQVGLLEVAQVIGTLDGFPNNEDYLNDN